MKGLGKKKEKMVKVPKFVQVRPRLITDRAGRERERARETLEHKKKR